VIVRPTQSLASTKASGASARVHVEGQDVAAIVSAGAAVVAVIVAVKAMRASRRSAAAAEASLRLNAGVAPALTDPNGSGWAIDAEPRAGTLRVWVANFGGGAMKIKDAKLKRTRLFGLRKPVFAGTAVFPGPMIVPAATHPVPVIEIVMFDVYDFIAAPRSRHWNDDIQLLLWIHALHLGRLAVYGAWLRYHHDLQVWSVRQDLEPIA